MCFSWGKLSPGWWWASSGKLILAEHRVSSVPAFFPGSQNLKAVFVGENPVVALADLCYSNPPSQNRVPTPGASMPQAVLQGLLVEEPWLVWVALSCKPWRRSTLLSGPISVFSCRLTATLQGLAPGSLRE